MAFKSTEFSALLLSSEILPPPVSYVPARPGLPHPLGPHNPCVLEPSGNPIAHLGLPLSPLTKGCRLPPHTFKTI